ncbi:hypothetical protein Bp8pS_099 [Bacillus phage vB_BpuM-BpSp]|nr:hypothetical protein Bp8pS_099 [Bacillus phage vB_BpuM-BpSp]
MDIQDYGKIFKYMLDNSIKGGLIFSEVSKWKEFYENSELLELYKDKVNWLSVIKYNEDFNETMLKKYEDYVFTDSYCVAHVFIDERISEDFFKEKHFKSLNRAIDYRIVFTADSNRRFSTKFLEENIDLIFKDTPINNVSDMKDFIKEHKFELNINILKKLIKINPKITDIIIKMIKTLPVDFLEEILKRAGSKRWELVALHQKMDEKFIIESLKNNKFKIKSIKLNRQIEKTDKINALIEMDSL